MIVGTEYKGSVQTRIREDNLQVAIDILELADLHQINMLFRDIVLDALLELFLIAYAFNRIAFCTCVNGNYAAELPRLDSPPPNGNIDPLVSPLFLNGRSGQSQTALKCRPNVDKVTVFRKEADVVDRFATMLIPEFNARKNCELASTKNL